MEPLIYSIIIIGSVLLIVCLIKLITTAFLTKRVRMSCIVTLIPVSGKMDDIEFTVRSILWSKNWDNYISYNILLVTLDCPDETYKICEKLCEEYEPVNMCKPSELESFIKNPDIFCEMIQK